MKMIREESSFGARKQTSVKKKDGVRSSLKASHQVLNLRADVWWCGGTDGIGAVQNSFEQKAELKEKWGNGW